MVAADRRVDYGFSSAKADCRGSRGGAFRSHGGVPTGAKAPRESFMTTRLLSGLLGGVALLALTAAPAAAADPDLTVFDWAGYEDPAFPQDYLAKHSDPPSLDRKSGVWGKRVSGSV